MDNAAWSDAAAYRFVGRSIGSILVQCRVELLNIASFSLIVIIKQDFFVQALTGNIGSIIGMGLSAATENVSYMVHIR